MTRRAALLAVALAGPGALAPGAYAGTFTIRQITVDGSTAVNATAINDHGDFVGTVLINGSSEPLGFAQLGGIFTPIEGPCGAGTCMGFPTAINKSGAITGLASGSMGGGFVWQNGAFVPGDFFGAGSNLVPASGPWINNRGHVAYTLVSSTAEQVFAGLPSSPKLQSGIGINANAATVTGFNDAGVLTGITALTTQADLLFVGHAGIFVNLNASAQTSGPTIVINDHNVIAGSAGSGIWIYANNGYTYAYPTTSVSGVVVSAINNTGRVAGTLFDPSGKARRVFLYAGGIFSMFGTYGTGDTLHVALNNAGALLVSVTAPIGGISNSFLAHCHGTGC
jgi:hypothetical protein